MQGDAYDLPRTLAGLAGRPIAAVVSSLPLLNQPPALRAKLIEDAFALMGPDGVFVQFTYGLASPIPRETCAQEVFRPLQRADLAQPAAGAGVDLSRRSERRVRRTRDGANPPARRPPDAPRPRAAE